MKYIVLIAFVLILGSLAFALVFMMKKGDSEDRAKRMVNSLTVRIGVSVLLFVTILLAWWLGLIAPTGRP